jgi:hypothetical protein
MSNHSVQPPEQKNIILMIEEPVSSAALHGFPFLPELPPPCLNIVGVPPPPGKGFMGSLRQRFMGIFEKMEEVRLME